MSVRFRKSKKIAPGTKINIGGKSAGVSFGNRGGGISFNSRSGARVRASIPGTGVSFSRKLGGRKKRKSKKQSAGGAASFILAVLVVILICWVFPIAIPFFILGAVVVFVIAIVAAKKKSACDMPGKNEHGIIPGGSVSAECPSCSARYVIQYRANAIVNGSVRITCPKCKSAYDVPVGQ